MQNYFSYKTAAKIYKKGRPNFHALVVNKIKMKLSFKEKLNTCLDVACGTGLLSEALLEIADKVIGLDNSEGMLSQVNENVNINYILGQAEELSIVNGFVDLITVSSAFHWFDQAAFLKSSYKKLKAAGYVVIHNNYFTSSTIDDASDVFKNWMTETYKKKFVNPIKNKKPVGEAEISSIGFEITEKEKFENIVSFNKTELVNYLITQSNIIANVECGKYTLEEVKDWLQQQLTIHFEKKESRKFIFGNHMVYLKKIF